MAPSAPQTRKAQGGRDKATRMAEERQEGKTMSKLTPKQEMFAKEYLIDLNATQAAIRAGYSKRTAKSQGQRLLTYVDVAELIQRGRERREAELDIKALDVIRELAKIGFANMLDYITIGHDGDPYVDLSSLTREQAAAIGEVTVEDFTDGRGEDAFANM